jgi:hypothetical protein
MLKWLKFGGFVCVRKSHFGQFPHFIWLESLEGVAVEHYVPREPVPRKIPPLVFDGTVKTED